MQHTIPGSPTATLTCAWLRRTVVIGREGTPSLAALAAAAAALAAVLELDDTSTARLAPTDSE